MAFLTDLFQAPPLTHRDDILFSFDPYTPSQTPPSRIDFRHSLPNDSDQPSHVMDLPNAFDQTSDVTHGLSYPHVEEFQLTEEFMKIIFRRLVNTETGIISFLSLTPVQSHVQHSDVKVNIVQLQYNKYTTL